MLQLKFQAQKIQNARTKTIDLIIMILYRLQSYWNLEVINNSFEIIANTRPLPKAKFKIL